MRRIFPLLIVGLFLLLITESAAACSCETTGSKDKDFDQAREKAKAVFVGRAVEVVDVVAHGGYSEKRVKLKVERYWKGRFNEEVTVFTGRNDCKTTFVVGDEYLVLAYRPDGERDLFTDHCMKSGLARNSANQLKLLGKAKYRAKGVKHTKFMQLTAEPVALTSYCDLFRDHDHYLTGKSVRVNATWTHGFEWSYLSCRDCPDGPKAWVEFVDEDERCPAFKKNLKKMTQGFDNKADVTVVGELRDCGGCGHMGVYHYSFVVTCLESFKKIPTAAP